MALTHAREGDKGSGRDRVSIPVTNNNNGRRAGQAPPRKKRSHKLLAAGEAAPPVQEDDAAARANINREMDDSSNIDSSSGSDSERGEEASDQEYQVVTGSGADVELQPQHVEGQAGARGIKRRRQHAQHTLPMPAYPGVALERRAVHHMRAQQYALRCALGLPVDIPYSAWGSLAQLKQQAKAAGITHIPEKVLLSYQPRDAPLRLIPEGAQVPQPGGNVGSVQQGGAGKAPPGFGMRQVGDATTDVQQVLWKAQASGIPPVEAGAVAAAAAYNTGHRDMRRLVLGEGQPHLKFSFKPASAHYEGLIKDVWMEVSSARQFGVEYVSLLAQQPVGPAGQWMTVSQCCKAVHDALLVVALGEQQQGSGRNAPPVLDAVAQQLEQQGVTHVPLMCLAAVMYKQPSTSLKSVTTGSRELVWRAWWPPACIQAVDMSPEAADSYSAAAGEDVERLPAAQQGMAGGLLADENATGQVTGDGHMDGEEDSGVQRLAARHAANMKAAGLQVMSMAEACVYLQHLKVGTRPSWAKPNSTACVAPELDTDDGVWNGGTLEASLSTLVTDTAAYVAPADPPAVQAAAGTRIGASAAAAAAVPGRHGRWVAALPSDIAMPVQHQPRAVSVEAASMLQHLHVPSSLLKGPPRTMCTLSDQCPTRDDAVHVVDAALEALTAHLGSQSQRTSSSKGWQAAKTQNTGPLSGEQLSRHLATLQAGAAAGIHLGLNPLASPALPKLGCGACATCTNAALMNQPCLRAGLLLQTMCASSTKAGKLGRAASASSQSQGDLQVDGVPDMSPPDSSAARRRLAHLSTKQALQREYRQQLEAHLLQSGQSLVMTPSECVADPTLWRAAPSGGCRGLFRTPRNVSCVQDSLLRIQDEEMQHAGNAMQVAAAAACPMVALQEPVLLRCDWCMAVDHNKSSCPLWQLMAYPALTGADRHGQVHEHALEQHPGVEAEQEAGDLVSSGAADAAAFGGGRANGYPSNVAALKLRAKRGRRAASNRQEQNRKGHAGATASLGDHMEQQQDQEVVDNGAGSSQCAAATATRLAARRGSCPASSTHPARSSGSDPWLHAEGSLVLQTGPRGQPTQVHARALPPPPGSDEPLTLQVRTSQQRPWQGVRVLQEQHVGILALEQHLTLQHQHSAAPTWLRFAPTSVVDGVVAMRNTLAWLGHGSANTAATQPHAASSPAPNGSAAHAQQPAAQSVNDDSGNACHDYVADDVWQSPEVCLALVLLAQEQAADLAWPSTR